MNEQIIGRKNRQNRLNMESITRSSAFVHSEVLKPQSSQNRFDKLHRRRHP